MNEASESGAATGGPRVGLFVTCLVDLMRPAVGFAAVELLERAGCTVEVPSAQTCCGQPAYNSGDDADTRPIAMRTIEAFEGFDYIVAPSGSCAGMLKLHYPELFAGDPEWAPRAEAFAGRVHELMQFLADVIGFDAPPAALGASASANVSATYHDSCSGLRELGIKAQPRKLLGGVAGLELREGAEAETCCGFGGLFCVKYPDISTGMVDAKIADIEKTGADMVLGGDLGCLMNMAGRLRRQGSNIAVRHAAEVLAGYTDLAPIAQTEAQNGED
jgi:L-lactate dehydrogenase complex protein LldE